MSLSRVEKEGLRACNHFIREMKATFKAYDFEFLPFHEERFKETYAAGMRYILDEWNKIMQKKNANED